METSADANFLETAKKLFILYKELGEKAMAQLEPEQLFATINEDTNSIAVIVQHLHGNMLSRFTDFLTTDGEKPTRNRDGEFEKKPLSKDALIKLWDEGWACVFNTVESLQQSDLSKIVYIRNEGHTVLEAIMRQVAHYSYHAGQIIYAAKMLKKERWDSLSIPLNKSNEFNAEKFAQDKRRKNFTDKE